MGLIRDAFAYCQKVNPKHYETLIKQRPAGSQWGRLIPWSPDTWSVLGWWEAHPDADLPPGTYNPACRYFISEHLLLVDGAVEHVARSTSFKPADLRLAQGVHGPELITTTPLPQFPAHKAWLILGPASKEDSTLVPWTAFPGEMAAPVPPGTTDIAQLDTARVPYAVKYYSEETLKLCS